MPCMYRSEGNLWCQFPATIIWILGIELKSSGLVARTIAYQAISLALSLQSLLFKKSQLSRPPCLSQPFGFEKQKNETIFISFHFQRAKKRKSSLSPHPDGLLCTRHTGKRNVMFWFLTRFPDPPE